MLEIIERAGRTCYKSEGKISLGSASPFVERIANVYQHESVLEHASVTVKLIVDRGVSHELVRHRLASYSQESTRYCNYSSGKFGRSVTFIQPPFWPEDSERMELWRNAMMEAEQAYFALIDAGAMPEEARDVLPNSTKTEVVMTANLREWRHVFKLRTSERAHPQMREIIVEVEERFQRVLPEIF